MKKKLGLVAVFVVLVFLTPSLLSSPSTEEIEGTLEVIMATNVAEKTCQPLYFVNVSGKRTEFSLPATTPLLSPGQKIKISGRWEEKDGKKCFHCRKIAPVVTAPVAKKAIISTDNVSNYLPKQKPVLNEQRAFVAKIAFSGHPIPEWEEDKVEDVIFNNKYSVNAYWQECSNGKMWLTGKCLGDWVNMSKPATEYGYGASGELDFFNELETDAMKALDPYVDFSQYDRIVFIRTGDWRYDFSTRGKWKYKTEDGEVELSICFVTDEDVSLDPDLDLISHELGHGLGLVHANNTEILTGDISSYGDWWDNRGARYAQLDGLHKYILGWLNTNQIEKIDFSGEYWLDQRELDSDGKKLLIIPLGYNENGEPILYYFEYFKELGKFDSRYIESYELDPKRNLVLLRKYKNEDDYDSLVYVFYGHRGHENKGLDIETEEFCDSDYENLDHYGVCVQVLQKTGEEAESKAKVKITLTSDYATPTPISSPTPTPSPTPSPSPTPTPTPTPTPSLTPTPTPTPILAEMNLEVRVKKVIFRKGGQGRKAPVKVTVTGTDNSLLPVDKIYCKMTRSDGNWLDMEEINTAISKFKFWVRKQDPPGRYKITATASKEGYKDATVEKFFKVK